MNIIREGNAERSDLDKDEAQITSLQLQKKSVLNACIPHDETRARLARDLASKVYRHGPANTFEMFQGGAHPEYAVLPDVFNVGQLVYVLGADFLLDAIMSKIEANSRPVGLSAEKRAKRIEELDAQLRKAERDAEIEALRLEDIGFTVVRREDADPAVLLDVWATLAA